MMRVVAANMKKAAIEKTQNFTRFITLLFVIPAMLEPRINKVGGVALRAVNAEDEHHEEAYEQEQPLESQVLALQCLSDFNSLFLKDADNKNCNEAEENDNEIVYVKSKAEQRPIAEHPGVGKDKHVEERFYSRFRRDSSHGHHPDAAH